MGDIVATYEILVSKNFEIHWRKATLAALRKQRRAHERLPTQVTRTVSFSKETKGSSVWEIMDMDGKKHEFLITNDQQVLEHDGQAICKA